MNPPPKGLSVNFATGAVTCLILLANDMDVKYHVT